MRILARFNSHMGNCPRFKLAHNSNRTQLLIQIILLVFELTLLLGVFYAYVFCYCIPVYVSNCMFAYQRLLLILRIKLLSLGSCH